MTAPEGPRPAGSPGAGDAPLPTGPVPDGTRPGEVTRPPGPVIVGVDGGPSSTDALTLGRWGASVLRLPLLVAAVYPAPSAIGAGRVDAEWVADRRRAAEAVLTRARQALGAAGDDTQFRTVASSSAAHGLHDLAEESGATAVVVGSGWAGPRQRLFAGSTAERLLAGSVCPVAIAPTEMAVPPGSLGRIAVAYVDTPDGRAALDAAARLARRTGTPLRLYTVLPHDDDASVPTLVGPDAERAFVDLARDAYAQALAKAAATVSGASVDTEVLLGDVVEALADITDADVLFCGSRGYGPARRVLLGGVSAQLLRRAQRPVVVVPRGA